MSPPSCVDCVFQAALSAGMAGAAPCPILDGPPERWPDAWTVGASRTVECAAFEAGFEEQEVRLLS